MKRPLDLLSEGITAAEQNKGDERDESTELHNVLPGLANSTLRFLVHPSPHTGGPSSSGEVGASLTISDIVPTEAGLRLHSLYERITLRRLQQVQHTMGNDEIEFVSQLILPNVFSPRVKVQGPAGRAAANQSECVA